MRIFVPINFSHPFITRSLTPFTSNLCLQKLRSSTWQVHLEDGLPCTPAREATLSLRSFLSASRL
ncbi:hypothetical protein PUN28_007656 [Cardiocondyla obscurior]|uniref:Uncharacterized protein n=1 Tax=Cardiocondyla obscurior TaxID=286306 RepID=A0AAW2G6M3_9HYME